MARASDLATAQFANVFMLSQACPVRFCFFLMLAGKRLSDIHVRVHVYTSPSVHVCLPLS